MVRFAPVIHLILPAFSFTLVLSVIGQRIGLSIRPIHYDLVFLPIKNSKYNRICGHVYINIEPTVTTNSVILNKVGLNILDVGVQIVTESKNESINSDERLRRVEDLCLIGHFEDKSDDVDSITHNDTAQQFSLSFKKPFVQNHKYRISLFYVGKVMDDIQGFFASNSHNVNASCNSNPSWFGGTQLQPSHARKVFPCFDEPGFKTTFDITIGHHRALAAISNMPESRAQTMASNQDWQWTKFERSPPMPTYLLAMFVTDYRFVERIYKIGERSVRMRFWSRPEYIPHLKHVSEMAPRMLHYLETYVKQPFTLPKIDFMSIPSSNFYAMENWGLITFDGKYLTHNEETDSQADLFQDYQILAHEMAHQFFGNLVTSDWWSDIWFNEGFSKSLEPQIVQQVIPSMKFRAEQHWTRGVQKVMKEEEEHIDRRTLLRDAETFGMEVFDSITYDKGSAVLWMLRNIVGHTHFRNAIVTYMERFQFKTANSYQFFEILDEMVHGDRDNIGRGLNISTIMTSWMIQPMYPIVRCTRAGIDGRIELSQSPLPIKDEPFAQELLNVTNNNHFTWWIPISITDARRPDFEGNGPRLWLTPDRLRIAVPYFPTSVDAEKHWIIINSQMSTYARVLYDEANWQLIARQLLANHTVIPRVTRAQLIDDAFSLASMDLLDYGVVMDVVEYTTVVQDDFVASTLLYYIHILMADHKEKNQTLYSLIEDYADRLLVGPDQIESFFMSGRLKVDSKTDPGCKNWSHGLCIEKTLRLFNALLDDTITLKDKKKVIEDLERYWCVAIRHGGKAEWTKAWQASIGDRWLSKRTEILSAMTCSQDRNRLKQFLSRVFDPAIRQDPNETFIAMEKMAANPTGRSIAFDFIKNNWDVLEQHFGNSDDNLSLLESMTKDLNEPVALKKVSQFLQGINQNKTETSYKIVPNNKF